MDHAFFELLSDLARRAIRDALAAGLTTESKDPDGFDPVTEADRAAERVMRARRSSIVSPIMASGARNMAWSAPRRECGGA